MNVEIKYQPSEAIAVVGLTPGESVQAEAGVMVSMTAGIDIQTQAKGGMLGGLKRSVLGGESFFLNTFTAAQGGQIMVASPLPGDVRHLQMTGQTMYLQSGSYMASSTSVQVDTKWGGAKTFFSGEGLFLLKVDGAGDLIISSYGAIHEVQLGAGEVMTLDTGHLVAFADGMGYQVRKVGGWKSTLLSGEGLVADLTGPGTLLMQTRSPGGFLGWLIPQLPTTNS
jgi:uncharacterized protein (TIGR00266 family)